MSRLNLATIVLGGHKRWGLNGETTSAAAQQGSPLRMQTLAITIGANRDDGSRVWAPISGFGPDATVSRGGVSEVDGNIDISFVGDPRARAVAGARHYPYGAGAGAAAGRLPGKQSA